MSPNGVKALVGELKDSFGETYGYAFSEPESRDGKQSTAVIWKTSQVEGAREEWPAEIEELLRLDSRDPRAVGPEAVHGKIFDRYPGLFSFKLIGRRPPFDFFVVPLHLKAMGEGGLRRRLASRILTRAVQALVDGGRDADIILGGDVNAPLASGDFDALAAADLVAMGAADEQAGGFSYIKGPRSLIDNIFLSPGMQQTVGADFIVARDRTVPKSLDLSDAAPVAVAVAVAAPAPGRRPTAGPADLDAIIERLLVASRAPAGRGARRGRGAVPAT